MTRQDKTAVEQAPLGTTLLPGVRLAELGGTELQALLAEPAGTLVAVCCVRGQAVALPYGSPLSCGEVLSLVASGAGEKCRVRSQEGPFQGVALLASPDAVAPGAAATLAGFDVDLAELVDATAHAGRAVDAAGTAVSQAFLDLAVGARGEGVAALKLRCVEALRCLCEARRQAAVLRRGPVSRADIARLALPHAPERGEPAHHRRARAALPDLAHGAQGVLSCGVWHAGARVVSALSHA